ncbi:MAG: hypothetical protein ACXVZ4_03200 [Gaiellaceae bacterium]
MRHTAAVVVAIIGLACAGVASARVSDDISVAEAHALAQQFAPNILLPAKLPAGIRRVNYLQGIGFTPGVKSADLFMMFHGSRTAPQFQLFIWRAHLRATIVRAMTVTYTDKHSKYLTHAFSAGRSAGTRVSYLSRGSTANVTENYIWETSGKTYVLSVTATRLGKTYNTWSKNAVIASFRAP